MATGASGGGGGAAVPARRAKADLPRDENDVARTARPVAGRSAGPKKANPTRTNPRSSPAPVRADQAAGGERRPRRRGRRGGRRRRGGPEDGLAGSIADELGPTSAPEATSAVADFDGYSSQPSPPVIQPESDRAAA